MINTENDVEGFYRKFQNNMIRSEVFSWYHIVSSGLRGGVEAAN